MEEHPQPPGPRGETPASYLREGQARMAETLHHWPQQVQAGEVGRS